MTNRMQILFATVERPNSGAGNKRQMRMGTRRYYCRCWVFSLKTSALSSLNQPVRDFSR